MSQEAVQGKSWRRHLWWQLALLAVSACLANIAWLSLYDQLDKFLPEAYTDCSSFNQKASGYKAFYELCLKLGMDTGRFQGSYRDLGKQKAVLLIIEPKDLLQKYEISKILAWVADGNDLVYLDHGLYGGARLPESLGLRVKSAAGLEDACIDKLSGAAIFEHVESLVLSSQSRLSGGKPLVCFEGDKDQSAGLFVELKHGKGRCLLGTVPGLCSNSRIADKRNWGNFQFLYNWLKSCRAPVLFDEKAHGHMLSTNYFVYLARGAAGKISLQILLIFLITVLSLNQAFGRRKSLEQARKIAAGEHIKGMAMTYLKARAFAAAFSILYGSFRQNLQRCLGMPKTERTEELALAWSEASGISYDEILSFLQESQKKLESETISALELLEAVKKMESLQEQSKALLPIGSSRNLGT